jgi:hypothetical protein
VIVPTLGLDLFIDTQKSARKTVDFVWTPTSMLQVARRMQQSVCAAVPFWMIDYSRGRMGVVVIIIYL